MANLRACPVARYRWPGYPTRLAALARPEVLARRAPAWRKGAGWASAAAVAVGAELAGCQKSPDSQSVAGLPGRTMVAPLFIHGDGRGAMGCVVTSPPVFLSEEEALQTIREEFRSHGVIMGDSLTLSDVVIPLNPYSRRYSDDANSAHAPRPSRGPLTLDLADANQHIAIEFASLDDHGDIAGPWIRNVSTVTDFRMQDVGRYVSEHAGRSSQQLYCAVFYDPLVRNDGVHKWVGKATQKEVVLEESKRLLRLQVKDFIDWLKGQGAI